MRQSFSVAIGRGLTALFALLCVTTCWAADRTFTLHNHTGREIREIYIGPMNSDRFGEDVVTGKIIPNGTSVQIIFRSSAPEKRWEMKVAFVNGTSTTWTNLDLSSINDLTISFKEGEPIAVSK